MYGIGRIMLLGVMTVLVSACGTMGLDKKAAQVDWSKGSIVVMSVDMTNEYRPSYGPTWLGMRIKKLGGDDQRGDVYASESVVAGQTNAILTQQVAPGSYAIRSLTGGSFKFPISAGFDFTVDAPFEVLPHSVVYLGHVALINREKTNPDDQATGAVIPLIDQAVAGFSGGTLQVTLLDRFEQDVRTTRQEYPALQNSLVVRAPLVQMALDRTVGSSAPKALVKLASVGAGPSVPTTAGAAQ